MKLAFHHDVTLALARITEQEIDRRYRRLARAAGLTNPRGGSVTSIQRFGGDLRANVHLHALALDGAYGTNARGEEEFFTAPAPSPPRWRQSSSASWRARSSCSGSARTPLDAAPGRVVRTRANGPWVSSDA